MLVCLCIGYQCVMVKVITMSRSSQGQGLRNTVTIKTFDSYQTFVLNTRVSFYWNTFIKLAQTLLTWLKSKSLNYLQHSFVRFFIRNALKVVYTFFDMISYWKCYKDSKLLQNLTYIIHAIVKLGNVLLKCYDLILLSIYRNYGE